MSSRGARAQVALGGRVYVERHRLRLDPAAGGLRVAAGRLGA